MPRSVSSAFLTALQQSVIRPALFAQLTVGDETVYVWTGIGDYAWAGQTWKGVGQLASVSTIEEGADIQARTVSVGLQGFDSNLLKLLLGTLRTRGQAFIWFALFTVDSFTLIPDPVLLYVGYVDQPSISETGELADLSMSLENKLVMLNVTAERRYTPEDQKTIDPTDFCMEYVQGIQSVNLLWGTR